MTASATSAPTRLAIPCCRGLALRESRAGHRERAERDDRIDEVEDLPGPTATGEQPEAARQRDDEREDDETARGVQPESPRGAPRRLRHGCLEPDEDDRRARWRSRASSEVRSRWPLSRRSRPPTQPASAIWFWTTPTMRTIQKIAMARNAQPRLRQLNAAAELSGASSTAVDERDHDQQTEHHRHGDDRAPDVRLDPEPLAATMFMPCVQLIGIGRLEAEPAGVMRRLRRAATTRGAGERSRVAREQDRDRAGRSPG